MSPVPISPVKVGHIDDVQELRKTKPTTIPERFVRDLPERPTLASPLQTDIPIVNLSNLIKPNSVDFHTELHKLTTACQEWGFFQVIQFCSYRSRVIMSMNCSGNGLICL